MKRRSGEGDVPVAKRKNGGKMGTAEEPSQCLVAKILPARTAGSAPSATQNDRHSSAKSTAASRSESLSSCALSSIATATTAPQKHIKEGPVWRRHVYPAKTVYEGYMVVDVHGNLMREGHGIYIDKCKNKYEGGWKGDRAQGWAKALRTLPPMPQENISPFVSF